MEKILQFTAAAAAVADFQAGGGSQCQRAHRGHPVRSGQESRFHQQRRRGHFPLSRHVSVLQPLLQRPAGGLARRHVLHQVFSGQAERHQRPAPGGVEYPGQGGGGERLSRYRQRVPCFPGIHRGQ